MGNNYTITELTTITQLQNRRMRSPYRGRRPMWADVENQRQKIKMSCASHGNVILFIYGAIKLDFYVNSCSGRVLI